MLKNIRDHFDINLRFWTEFPEYRQMPGFSSLYKSDRSATRKESSKIAWGIHLAYHPDSKFYSIPNKLELITRDVIKREKFKWTTPAVSTAIEYYKMSVLTQAERSLISWSETMILRDKGLKEWYKAELSKDIEERDISTITDLDRQMSNTAKFFLDYKKIMVDLLEEQQVKKNKIISASDTDEF